MERKHLFWMQQRELNRIYTTRPNVLMNFRYVVKSREER